MTTPARHPDTPKLLSREQALAAARLLMDRDALLGIESVAVGEAQGRVLALSVPWGLMGFAEGAEPGCCMLPAGRCLTAEDIGALAFADVAQVDVYERVRMTYVSSGDEVLRFVDRPVPGPGDVVESNSQVFLALAKQWGAQGDCLPPVPDDRRKLLDAVEGLLQRPEDTRPHIIVLGAGSARGTHDFSRQIFETIGEMVACGMAMVPGKSAKLAVARGRLLVNAPGRPPGAYTIFREVVAPMAAWLGHRTQTQPDVVPARLLRSISSRAGLERLVPMGVGLDAGDKPVAEPLNRERAGMFEALAVSQGVVRLAPGVGNVERGEQVLVEMSGDGFPLRLSVAFAGERDPVLDRLSNALMAQEPPLRLLRVAGGGDEARQALARGDARFALVRTPVSGPQADSGPLRNAFGQGILLVHRRTGLAVAPGNPRGITDPHGAEADGARLVNLVSECALRLDGVVAACGEEGTEKGVAACVAAGMADCGPCSEETALSLGLGFVPLGEERVELLFSTADEPVRDALVRAANGI